MKRDYQHIYCKRIYCAKQGNLPAAYQLLSELYQQHSQNEKSYFRILLLAYSTRKNSQAEQLVAKQPASLRQN